MEVFLDGLEQEVCICNKEWQILFCNKQLLQQVGMSLAEVVGQHVTKCFDFAERREYNVVVTREVNRYTAKMQSSRGNDIICKIDVCEGNYKGDSVYYITSRNHIKEIKEAEGAYALTEELYKQYMSELESFEQICETTIKGEEPTTLNVFEQTVDKYVQEPLNVWIYNEEKSALRIYFAKEEAQEMPEDMNEWEVSPQFVEEIKTYYKQHKEPIILSSTLLFGLILQYTKGDDMHPEYYVMVYPVMYGEEFLGIISIAYSHYEEAKLMKKYIIQALAQQMALIMRKDRVHCKLERAWEEKIIVEEELHQILDVAAEMIVYINEDGEILSFNDRTTEMLGLTREELLVTPIKEIIHEDDVNIVLPNLVRLSQEKVAHTFTGRCKKKNGELLWTCWSGIYLDNKGYILCAGKNITHEKYLEQKEELANQVIEMEKVRNEFLANVSHELKTPLAMILASVQMIDQAVIEETIQTTEAFHFERYITMVRHNTYRLIRLVNNLIDITKIEAGYYKLRLRNVEIISLIEDITQSVVIGTENKQIELIFDTEVEEEILVCDPEKVERIMLNLLSNAIKYTPKEGEINVDISLEEDFIKVSVRDNGEGIPEDKLEQIFDRFMQVDQFRTGKVEGSGIGLSIVKGLVELHGGTIYAESVYGEGTNMVFTLPRKVLEEEGVSNTNEPINGRERCERCHIELSDISE